MFKGYKQEVLASSTYMPRPRTLEITANQINSGGATRGPSTTATGIQGFFRKPLMENILIDSNKLQVREVARDAYFYDPISGAAVQLLSILPWSNVTLTGIKDDRVREKYSQSIANMNLMMLMPELTTDFLVNGTFIANAIFDEGQGCFTGIAPQDIDSCVITPVPLYGRDPLIDVRLDASFKRLLDMAQKDPRARDVVSDLGSEFEKAIKIGYMQLQPETTIYLPRREFSTQIEGSSYLQRILPYWIIEKALLRGTIELSYRRQKSILHLLIGDEEWEPTTEEMQNYVQLFLNADQDPTGAVIATRQGVVPTELGNASGFWRIDEISQFSNDSKYKALGISESIIVGDANLNTMDTAMSTFLERLRYMRFNISQRMFNGKLFPHIAVKNGFRAKKDQVRHEVQGSNKFDNQFSLFAGNMEITGSNYGVYAENFNPAEYQIPKLNWIKHLKPEADSAYMEILDKLEQKGLPIPLRMWAAAGGVNIAEMMYGYEDDVRIRKLADAHKKKLPRTKSDDGESYASLITNGEGKNAVELMANPNVRKRLGFKLLASTLNKRKPKRFGDFNFDERHREMRDPDTGKLLSKKGRRVREERVHKVAAEALSRIAQRDNYIIKNDTSLDDVKKRIISYSKNKKVS